MTQNLALVAAIVGFFLPHLIALLNQAHWSPRTKSIVAFACCAIAAVVTSAAAGKLDVHDLTATLLLIFTTTRVSYAGLWQPTGIAPALEEATSPGAPISYVQSPDESPGGE